MVEFLDYARQRKAILYYDPNFRKAHAHEAIHLAPTLLENFEYANIIRGSDEDFLNIFGEPTVKKSTPTISVSTATVSSPLTEPEA